MCVCPRKWLVWCSLPFWGLIFQVFTILSRWVQIQFEGNFSAGSFFQLFLEFCVFVRACWHLKQWNNRLWRTEICSPSENRQQNHNSIGHFFTFSSFDHCSVQPKTSSLCVKTTGLTVWFGNFSCREFLHWKPRIFFASKLRRHFRFIELDCLCNWELLLCGILCELFFSEVLWDSCASWTRFCPNGFFFHSITSLQHPIQSALNQTNRFQRPFESTFRMFDFDSFWALLERKICFWNRKTLFFWIEACFFKLEMKSFGFGESPQVPMFFNFERASKDSLSIF